jgi:hypothetical protein
MKKILTKIKIIFTLIHTYIHTYIRLFYKKGGSSLILEPSLFLRKEVTGTI